MKKKNNLFKFLAIGSAFIQIALIWFTTQDSFLKEYPRILLPLYSIVFMFLMLVTFLYEIKGEMKGKGKSLNKKDIEIGSKIKILYDLSKDGKSLDLRCVIQTEDAECFILNTLTTKLNVGENYILSSELEWEKVS